MEEANKDALNSFEQELEDQKQKDIDVIHVKHNHILEEMKTQYDDKVRFSDFIRIINKSILFMYLRYLS